MEPGEKLANQAYCEMGLLGNITTIEDFRRLQLARPHFTELYAPIWDRIQAYVGKAGDVPTRDVLRSMDPEWQFLDGAFDYWFSEYTRLRTVYEARDAIRKALDDLEDDPHSSVDGLITRLQSINNVRGLSAVATDTSVDRRYQRYVERMEALANNPSRLWGINTGIWTIDQTRQGWMGGELIGVYGRPTVGKSWFLLRAGVIAWLIGKRVLMISPEMTEEQVSQRVDAIIAGMNGIPFSHQAADTGLDSVREHYQQLVEFYRSRTEQTGARWWTIDSGLTMAEVETQVGYYDPDFVIVDGIMLMRDSHPSGQKSWEQVLERSYALKTIATNYETTIMVSNQAVNTRRGRRTENNETLGRGDDWTMPSLNDSAYGDSFVQAMSTVITLAPDRDSPYLRWYSIRKARERRIDFHPRSAMAWDVDRGLMIDLGHHGVNIDAIHNEMRMYGIGQR